jgi:hypothetical protein
MVLALALGLCLTAPPAAAEQSFRTGRRLLQEGKIAEACAAFDDSQRLDPALGTLLNLAECEAQLGHHARAYALFQEVLSWSRRTQQRARENVALDRLAELKTKVALVVVDAPSGARVLLDGLEVQIGSQLPVEPGQHEAVASLSGRVLSKTFEVKAGDSFAVRPEPLPAAPQPVPPSTAEPAPSLEPRPAPEPPAFTVQREPARRRSPLGPALLAGGAALLVAGISGTAWSVLTWQRAQQQQAGGPDYDHPTVTRGDFQRAGIVYPLSLAMLGVALLVVAGGALLTFGRAFE